MEGKKVGKQNMRMVCVCVWAENVFKISKSDVTVVDIVSSCCIGKFLDIDMN